MTEWFKPAELDELAPMSASVSRLARVIGQPDSEVNEITRVIELDQALTANVLHWANSVWSGARTPISSVREAVVRLGGGTILKLTVGRHLAKGMQRSLPGYVLAEKEMWRHSVAAALAVEQLGRIVKRSLPAVTFTAALLHDVGKLVLSRHVDAGRLGEINRLIASDGLTHFEAECRVLGTNHASIGGEIGRHWKFPEALIAGIERHHDPDAQPEPVLDAVHVANVVAKLIGVGLGGDQFQLKASAAAAERLGLTAMGVETLCAAVTAELGRAESIWEV